MRVSQVQSCVSVAMDGSIYHPVKHVYLCVTVSQRLTVNDSRTLCACVCVGSQLTLGLYSQTLSFLSCRTSCQHHLIRRPYTHRKINASHMRRTFFRVQQHQGKHRPPERVGKHNIPVKTQTGVEKRRFVNNGAQLEREAVREMKDKGPQIKSPWLIESRCWDGQICAASQSSVQ